LASRFSSALNLVGSDVAQLRILLSTAITMQTRIFLYLLAAAGSFFLMGMIFLVPYKWSEKKVVLNGDMTASLWAQRFKRWLVITLWVSTGLATVSSASITQISAALQFWTMVAAPWSIVVSAGVVLQVLQWLIVGLSTVLGLAITLMVNANQVSSGTKSVGGLAASRPKPTAAIGGITGGSGARKTAASGAITSGQAAGGAAGAASIGAL
jgi:hypothetical protein